MKPISKRLENISPISVATVVVILWMIVALAVDRLLLGPAFPELTKALGLGITVKLPAGQLVYPPVSMLLLIVLPMLILAFYLMPWKDMKNPEAWHEAFSLWAQPWFWLMMAVLLTIFGESLYVLLGNFLPHSAKEVFETFTVSAEVSVVMPGFKPHTAVSLNAGLVGFAGFVFGVYLFLERGVGEALK